MIFPLFAARHSRRPALLLFAALLLPAAVHAQASAPAQPSVVEVQGQVAAIATKALVATDVPSASVGVMMDGRVVDAQAFGLAHVQPPVLATGSMAYPIGSISKQFTAAALLLLQQQGKLALDDKVAKYFPELTRANDITLRNLLTMTSGYEDYAPQDYIIPAWLKPVQPLALVHEWAEKPLDFEPGTAWQYSNTNYVLAGLVVEKVSGEPLMQFLREHIFTPLHMQGVINTYTQREQLQVTGYVSHAMAPVRVQPLEATGWYQGDGDLAMPASTLLVWDLSIAEHSLLSAESYKQFETPFILKNGKSSDYGLGIDVHTVNGQLALEHSGEVGGFVAENIVLPQEKFAVAVLTNEVASEAASQIGRAVEQGLNPQVFPPPRATDNAPKAPAVAQPETGVLAGFGAKLTTILDGLAREKIDRALFTSDCNAYFDVETLADFHLTLAPYGQVSGATLLRSSLRGGMTFGLYRIMYANGPAVLVTVYLEPDGKIEQLLVVGKA